MLAALPQPARLDLEEFMTIAADRYESDVARRFFEQGEARAVLAVLESGGLEVSPATRERVTACTDLDRLDQWIHRAMTIDTVDELFPD